MTMGWQRRHAERVARVSAPYGPFAPTGTHWREDHPDGQLPDIPGRWTTDGARVAGGERRPVVLVREGLWGVRDFDPAAPARRAFRGIAATPYDPRWWCRAASPRTRRVRAACGCRTRTDGSAGRRSAGNGPSSRPGGTTRSRWASRATVRCGPLRRRHQRGHQLPLPVPAPGRAGRRGAYDGRPQPCRAAAVRVRRPLRLSLPAAGEHPGDPRRRGGARTALRPSEVW